MTQRTVDEVLADVRALSPEEQRHVRATLDAWLAPPPTSLSEDAFEQQLVAQGILSAVPPLRPAVPPAQPRTRLQVHGTPLSETILEDRA